MSDFAKYLHAQTESKRAFAEYNSAGAHLELARIKERLAEIQSQHEPLNSLLGEARSERDRLYAAAHYVVVGRLPKAKGGGSDV